jgi:DNA-binding response OmpR family regulator
MQLPVPPAPGTTTYSLRTLEVDFEACELRRQGTNLKMHEQPFQVLKILLRCPV